MWQSHWSWTLYYHTAYPYAIYISRGLPYHFSDNKKFTIWLQELLFYKTQVPLKFQIIKDYAIPKLKNLVFVMSNCLDMKPTEHWFLKCRDHMKFIDVFNMPDSSQPVHEMNWREQWFIKKENPHKNNVSAAGCRKVFWLDAFELHLRQAAA